MNDKRSLLSACSLLAISLLVATGAQSRDQPAKHPSETVPPGFALIQESTLVYLQETPTKLIDSAHQEFSQKNYGDASMDLGEAAVLLKAEAKRSPKGDGDLEAAADRLLVFGHKVGRGEINSDSEFRAGVSDAFLYKAQHHRTLAAREWTDRQLKVAGHDLRAAADATENAAKWTGQEVQKGMTEAVNGAREVAATLIKGAGWTATKVGNALDSLGTETKRLATKVGNTTPTR